jgi:hypothetical protein
MLAPRARAFSASSSTSTAAPSPITKPSRRASKGREMPVSESASRAAKAALASGVSAASEPPVTTASASPAWIMRADAPIAWAPAAQADRIEYECPRSLWRMATAAAPALPIMSGTASGETRSAPFSIRVSLPCSSVPMPPIPVPMMQPMRAGS